MPATRLDIQRITPRYPQNKNKRHEYFEIVRSLSTGYYFNLKNDNIDDNNYFINLENTIKIDAKNFYIALYYLMEYDISRLTRSSNNLFLIKYALNNYAALKSSFIETAPKTNENRSIFYRIDYLKNIDDKLSYEPVFNGRCCINLPSEEIEKLSYYTNRQQWREFWMHISLIYERTFKYSNKEIDRSDFLREDYVKSSLELYYEKNLR